MSPTDDLDAQITALPEPIRRRFACACARHVLRHYQVTHPFDQRLRKAINAARAFAMGEATEQRLLDALAQAEAARDAIKAEARALEKATWDAWRNDPRQREPPRLSREDQEDLPRDAEWWRHHDARMKAAGWAAAWLNAGAGTRQRWIRLRAAWFAAEAAAWAAWLDTDYAQEVLAATGTAGLTDARYAIYAAHYAARCPAEQAALATLDAVEHGGFFSYYGAGPQVPAGYVPLAYKYSQDMEAARQAVIAEQEAWQARTLERLMAKAAHPAGSRCNEETRQRLTHLLLEPPDGQETVAQDALRSLLAQACALDPLALLEAIAERDYDSKFHHELIRTLTDAVEGGRENAAWHARYQEPLAEALLRHLETAKLYPYYESYARLLCRLGDRRVLDVLRRDFKTPRPRKQPVSAMSRYAVDRRPGIIANVLGDAGDDFDDVPAILAELLHHSANDETRLALAKAYVKTGGVAAVDFLIEEIYPRCGPPRPGMLHPVLALLSDVQGEGVVEAWLAHLHEPEMHVQRALFRALMQYYRFSGEEKYPREPVVEALAGLLDPQKYPLIYRAAIDVLKSIGRTDALPYLQEALARVEGEIERAAFQNAIKSLERRKERS